MGGKFRFKLKTQYKSAAGSLRSVVLCAVAHYREMSERGCIPAVRDRPPKTPISSNFDSDESFFSGQLREKMQTFTLNETTIKFCILCWISLDGRMLLFAATFFF